MSLPFLSLDAATADGPGEVRDLGGVFDHHTLIVTTTGSPSAFQVQLQGSHDLNRWANLGAVSSAQEVTAPSTSSPGHLVRYVRANLVNLSGGTSPTITATIASDTTGED